MALKTWGMSTTAPAHWPTTTTSVRVIVAASSRKAAAQAMRNAGIGYSDYAFGQFASVSGNDTEIAATQPCPGIVFYAPEQGTSSTYRMVP
jgi:hypothetical protein